MRISVWNHDLSDSYLRQVTQLGADCIDFGGGDAFPGTREQGYPDLDHVREIKRRIRAWGLDINRVTLPNIGEKFMKSLPGGEQELDSDLDLLIEFHDPPGMFGFVRLENELSELLGVQVDLVMKSALKPNIGRYILNEVQLV